MVTELSRLSRSVSDFLKFMELLTANNSDFICPQYDFDTTNAAGRVFVIILMALSQFERELTGERTRNNFFSRAMRGLCNGGSPILGYDTDPINKAKRVVNEPEAAIVRQLYQLYIETGSIQSATDAVNASGARTKNFRTRSGTQRGGHLFVNNSVHGILTNVTYLGKREVNKANKGEDANSLKESERYQVVDATWPAIVDEQTFTAVQSKLAANREFVKFDQWKVYPFVFSKRIRCLECGADIRTTSAHGRNEKYSYYRHVGKCSAGINLIHADEMETLVFRRLKELDATPQFLDAIVRNQHKLVSDKGPSVEADRLASESEMRQVQEKIEALVDRIASLPKTVDANVLIQKVGELQARKAQLADYIVRLNAELAGMSREKQNPEEVRKAIRVVNTRLSELSAPLKREIIRQLITQIEFGRKVMKVTLNPMGLIAENPRAARDSQGIKKPASSCIEVSPVCLLSKMGSQVPRQHQNKNLIRICQLTYQRNAGNCEKPSNSSSWGTRFTRSAGCLGSPERGFGSN
jgi:DNA invertase Pin-like site-specific DNA recombinase/uncharacterized small protein (DUF1192 family)